MKHPKFRVKSVLDLDKSVLDELEELLCRVIKLFTDELLPVDIEIVGSYANGYAGLHSDIDIAIPMRDWNSQMVLRRAIYGDRNLGKEMRELVHDFEERYQIKLDINPVIPDNKENKTYATYSLFERKLYNKPADLSKFYLAMFPYIQKYGLKQYELDGVPVDTKREVRAYAQPKKFTEDNFISELEEWRRIYGNKFIEYKTLPDRFLSE
jgi:predicted nucleotidyltransferase